MFNRRGPRERLELGPAVVTLRRRRHARDEVRLGADELVRLDPFDPLHREPERTVADARDVVHERHRARGVEIRRIRRRAIRVLLRDERDQAIGAERVVHELQRAFLADQDRRDGRGEENGFAQG